MRRALRHFVWVLPVACACSRDLSLPPLPGQAGAGSVFGRAVYTTLGAPSPQPAAGALITLVASSFATHAGTDGRFDVEGISTTGGQLTFQLDTDGDGVFDRQRTLALDEFGAGPGRQIDLGDVTIGESARLHGYVLRADLQGVSAGHAGTQVFVPLTSFNGYAATDGLYTLDSLPAGQLSLGFFRPGYAPQSLTDLELQPGEDLAVATVLLARDDGTQTGLLTGAVAYAPASPSSPGTAVTATSSATGTALVAQTDSDGGFAFPALPIGLYEVSATHAGYTPLAVPNVLVFAGQTTTLALALGQGEAIDAGHPTPPDAGPQSGVTARAVRSAQIPIAP